MDLKREVDLGREMGAFIRKYRNVNNGIAVYNEFSLQHELGFFLRSRLKRKGYKVEFERNVSFFGINERLTKHEIDISIYKGDPSGNCTEKYAIELKYPRNGQYPESMYSFVKDIKFMEELRANGFNGTAVLTFVDDSNFYSGEHPGDIYRYFRYSDSGATTPISGVIEKPTGCSGEYCKISGSYNVNWEEINADMRYYIIDEIVKDNRQDCKSTFT